MTIITHHMCRDVMLLNRLEEEEERQRVANVSDMSGSLASVNNTGPTAADQQFLKLMNVVS